MSKLGYFPGCSLEGSAREFGESLAAVAGRLGKTMEEIADWNCCGASAAHMTNHKLGLALPARTLALAEKQGLGEVVVPCAACFSRLAAARQELAADAGLRKEIGELIEMEVRGSVRLINVLELLAGWLAEPAAQAALTAAFSYPVACYYGCLLVRPPKVVNFDRPEDPTSLDEIVRQAGAQPIPWAFKTECCGAGLSVTRTDVVAKLGARILEDAVKRGARAVVVACPMCHGNLDMRRSQIEAYAGRKFDVPVLYVTQVVGLALGLDPAKLGFKRHFVPVRLTAQPRPAQPSV